ncbi:MAG: hydroxyacid dehydrogenase [Acidimicrobiia bacterium]
MADRPGIVFGMLDGMLEHLVTRRQLERLEAVGRILDRRPLAAWDDPRADDLLAEAEVLFGHWGCPTLTAEVLDRAPRLRLFAYAAGTVKWQVTDAVFARGIVVTSAAAANAVPVAEYTIAAILLANKGVFLVRERQRDPAVAVTLDLARVGNRGTRVGIVGASFVGRLVIEGLRATDLELAVYDPFLSTTDAGALGVEKVDDLDELCGSVRLLSIHAPDIPPTRGMIGARQLALLPDGATVVNTARPALVDQDALVAELTSGRLAAVLDVTDPDPLPAGHPLLALPNAFVTPHVAGAMGNELARLSELAVTEVERHVAGAPPLHPVVAADLDRIA